MEVQGDYSAHARAVDTEMDFKEIPAALSAVADTLNTLEVEVVELLDRLKPICAPPPDEKQAEPLMLGPSSELAQTLASFERRIASIRNAIYDTGKRLQL